MDPAKMKVVDLRSELGALGLDTKGNKPALVERLKKALEAKSGKAIADTTILDTSTEDADEPATPRRAGPAARTRRRSSSSRVVSTPAKVTRVEAELIEEEPKPVEPEPEPVAAPEPVQEPTPEPVREPTPEPVREPTPEPVREPTPEPVLQPQPVPAPTHEPEQAQDPDVKPQIQESDMYNIDDDEKSQSPPPVVKKDVDEEPMEVDGTAEAEAEKPSNDEAAQDEGKTEVEGNDKTTSGENKYDHEETEAEARQRELTEEEEWEQLNERLEVRERERLERERRQREDDARRLEELSNDPVKLQRFKRKHEKKARWSNFYKAVEITNEVLTPPAEDPNRGQKGKKQEALDNKAVEPEIDDNKMTLSWYDSDLNQYLEVPDLVSVVPLSDGAFAHAWAGARASHGVAPDARARRVCYEVRVGAVVTTTESAEKEAVTNGLRVGWSTDDSSLHLGEGDLSFGYESTGRFVTNGEFKEYGKTFTEKDVIGAYLDLESEPCKISYTLNGVELGVAHEFERSALGDKALFPHVLTKNICYRVNFGDDRYNMLTRTKIVRKRIEIPIEQVLEEKRQREEQIQRDKEEAARREKERRERDKREREERQRKKREERERQDRERREREAQERGDDKDAADQDAPDADKPPEPKENGDKADESVEVKPEPVEAAEPDNGTMEVDKEPAEADNAPAEADKEPAEADKAAAEADKEPAEADKAAAEADAAAPEAESEPQKEDGEEKIKEEPAPEGEIPEMTEEQVLKGHVLDKRIKFVTRFTVEQELDGAEACLLPGYVLIARADLTPGPRRPAALADCEVILMVGMPGAGKTYWAQRHAAAHPERRYNLLSTAALFDRMQVDCKPFRAACEGRWDAMLSKGAKCVLKLLEFAHGRRRNYILDQRRKLREFEGYRRVAVVVVPEPAAHAERVARREAADGKEIPDGAVVDMKANFALPARCSWLDEVRYAELGEAEARAVLEGFHKEARAAGVLRERRDRSAPRDAPPPKRARSPERRHPRDERRKDFSRDREDRWSGGGSRWGPARGGGGGGGGGRWGGARDRPPPPQGRFDRGWGPRDNEGGRGGGGGGGGFGRERDGGFRGGRGGFQRERPPPGPPRPDARFPRPDRARPHLPDKRLAPLPGPNVLEATARRQLLLNPSRPPAPPDRRFGPPDGNARVPPPPPSPQDKGPELHQHGGAVGGGWQRGGRGGRGGHAPRGGAQSQQQQMQRAQPGKDGQQGQGQGQNQQQGWNQWANSGWGGWGNWNQNQANWSNWSNWGNWNNAQQQQGAGAAGGQAAAGKGQGQAQTQAQAQGAQATQQQWQQWYQWQQWQQQQGWPQYGQQQQGGAAGTGTAAATTGAGASTADQQAQWAQYYQNYNANAAAGNATADKK